MRIVINKVFYEIATTIINSPTQFMIDISHSGQKLNRFIYHNLGKLKIKTIETVMSTIFNHFF